MSREVQVRFCESRGVRFPPATHLVVMCWSRSQAEAALARLTGLLAGLGLEPKAAKTRIVHLDEGGEGLDFLGFHHGPLPLKTDLRATAALDRRLPSSLPGRRAHRDAASGHPP